MNKAVNIEMKAGFTEMLLDGFASNKLIIPIVIQEVKKGKASITKRKTMNPFAMIAVVFKRMKQWCKSYLTYSITIEPGEDNEVLREYQFDMEHGVFTTKKDKGDVLLFLQYEKML